MGWFQLLLNCTGGQDRVVHCCCCYLLLLSSHLLWWFEKNTNLNGIKIGTIEHRITLYADDVILFCSSLKQNITTLLSLTNTFGVFAVYKINSTKSLILFMNDNERLNPPVHTPFLVSLKGFVYLGVKIALLTNTDKMTKSSQWTTIP